MKKLSLLNTLFFMFFKLGFFSFGGGYAMIPLIENELLNRGISLTPEVISNVTAIAGISPGPVGVNASVAFGYQIAGFGGVLFSFMGIALPSLIIVIFVASIFRKVYSSKLFRWSLNGLRPIIVGIIAYGAVSMAIKNGMVFATTESINNGIYLGNNMFFEMKSIILMVGALILLVKTKLHPVLLIMIGGLCGVMFF